MSEPRAAASSGKLVAKLVGVAIGMFVFGFVVLPPLYDAFCDITGLNGKTGRVDAASVDQSLIDKDRWVTVEFVSTVNGTLPWDFKAEKRQMKVNPGAVNEAFFVAHNRAGHVITGQAVPSVAPAKASKYFNKTECFCFTQQTLTGGEERQMPLQFIVNAGLPKDVKTITLSYTFFETGEQVATAAQ